MKMVLIRHGSRDHRSYEESKAPLSASGRQEVEQLAAALGQFETAPTLCLTSTKFHAEQTGTILTAALGCAPPVVP